MRQFAWAGAIALTTIAPVSIPSVAEAQSARPDTRTLTCQGAQDLVGQRGAVVMTTGDRTYDRFVGSLQFCDRSETFGREFVRTRDNANCPLTVCRRPLRRND